MLKGQKMPEEQRLKIGRANRGKKRSKELCDRLSESRRAENNPNWRGGTTRASEVYRNQREFRFWRRAVLERDFYRCVLCGSDEQLEADHIKPKYTHPELLHDIDNGRTLCKPCHIKQPTHGVAVHPDLWMNKPRDSKGRFRSNREADC